MSKLLGILLFLAFFASSSSFAAEQKVIIHNEGWELIGELGVSQSQNPKGFILMLHKAAGTRSEYISMANKANKLGFHSLRLDLRGNGESINLGAFDYLVKKNFEINDRAWSDIAAAHKWIKSDPRFKDLPLIYMGGSYSGEKMVNASDVVGFADAYIEMSPGSFSEESIAKIDESGKPWVFTRVENERPFFTPLYQDIRDGSKNAEIWVYPGEAKTGHATRILSLMPEIEDLFLEWILKSIDR